MRVAGRVGESVGGLKVWFGFGCVDVGRGMKIWWVIRTRTCGVAEGIVEGKVGNGVIRGFMFRDG